VRKKLVSGRGAGLLLEGWGAGWEGRGGREVSGTSLDWRRTSTDWEGPGEGEGWILNGNYLTTGGRENIVGRGLQGGRRRAGVAVAPLRHLVVRVPPVRVRTRRHPRTEPQKSLVVVPLSEQVLLFGVTEFHLLGETLQPRDVTHSLSLYSSNLQLLQLLLAEARLLHDLVHPLPPSLGHLAILGKPHSLEPNPVLPIAEQLARGKALRPRVSLAVLVTGVPDNLASKGEKLVPASQHGRGQAADLSSRLVHRDFV